LPEDLEWQRRPLLAPPERRRSFHRGPLAWHEGPAGDGRRADAQASRDLTRAEATKSGVSFQYISQAQQVIDFAHELADGVLAGTVVPGESQRTQNCLTMENGGFPLEIEWPGREICIK
jgi:hypothetical protein